MSKHLTLINGVLYNDKGESVYDEADYFSTAEEAERWLKENGTPANVKEEQHVSK